MSKNKMKIHELYDGPDKWTKDEFAKDGDGDEAEVDNKDAVCWCLVGAARFCYDDETAREEVFQKMAARIAGEPGAPKRPVSASDQEMVELWNDDPDREFREVRALVLELDV
jgi:hypothetical protein